MKILNIAASAFLLSSVSAIAADLPSIKSAPVASPTPIWTGFYAGLNAGVAWSNNNTINSSTWTIYQPAGSADSYTSAILSTPKSLSSSLGFIGGGQIGYNWQTKINGFNFITSVEADIQGNTGPKGNLNYWDYRPNAGTSWGNNTPFDILTNIHASSNLSWLGTVRGRFGYLFMPSLLIYGTGGLAYGNYTLNIQHDQGWSDNSHNGWDGFNPGNSRFSSTMVGWTAGAGAEWMFLQHWSAKVEYLYYDLGNASGSMVVSYYGLNTMTGSNGLQSITNYSQRINGNIIRAGVNYHFDFANAVPVVAKY